MMEPDATKTVLAVELSVLTENQDEAIEKRNSVTSNMKDMGYYMLESCNLRLIFYDYGIKEAKFTKDVAKATRTCCVRVEFSGRLIDPGNGLVFPREEAMRLV